MTTPDDEFEALGEEVEKHPLGNPLAGRSAHDVFLCAVILLRTGSGETLDPFGRSIETLGFVLASNGAVRSFIRPTHNDPRWIIAAKAIVNRLKATEPKTAEDIRRFSKLEGNEVRLGEPMLVHEYWPTYGR